MTKVSHYGRVLLLTVLAVGMNLLSYANMAHGRRATHHSRVNYSHVPPHGSHRPTSRGGRAPRLTASDNLTQDHSQAKFAPKLKPIDSSVSAVLLTPTVTLQTEMTSEPLAQVNVVAIGSAPRAPGGSRAPPIA